eukprot:3258_1
MLSWTTPMQFICTIYTVIQSMVVVTGYKITFPNLINNEYNCSIRNDGSIIPADESIDYCIIDCNQPRTKLKPHTAWCRHADNCFFRCNADACFDSGSIFASDATILSVSSNANECMRGATVYTPNLGRAIFQVDDLSSLASLDSIFMDMTIHDGIHTESISVTCSSKAGTNECKSLTINATRTQYLEVIADDNATIDYSIIHCPQDSPHNGPEASPCVVDVSAPYVSATNLEIHTLQGAPYDVTFTGSDTGVYTDCALYCTAGISHINGNSFTNGDCWMQPSQTTTTAAVTTTYQPITTTNKPITTTHKPTTATSSTDTVTHTTTATNDDLNTTSEPVDSAEVQQTTSIGLNDTESTNHEEKKLRIPSILTENLWIDIGIAVLLIVLIISCCVCCMCNRKKMTTLCTRKVQQGESDHEECSAVMSHEIAPPSEITTELIDDMMEVEFRQVEFMNAALPSSIQSNDTMKQMLREGRVSEIIYTPQMPDLREQITAEEIQAMKEEYQKKKSTLYDEEQDHDIHRVLGNNDYNRVEQQDMDDMDDEESSDSEELYVVHPGAEVQRYETPTLGPQKTCNSSNKEIRSKTLSL